MPNEYVHVEYDECLRVTEKAIQISVEGEGIWIPFSQIAPDDREGWEPGIGCGSVCITEWIAREKGLT